jgi:hypothetical protein
VIEDFSIASFQVLKAVDDVCIDGSLDLQPPLGPFLLKQVDRPHERGPAGFVRCSASMLENGYSEIFSLKFRNTVKTYFRDEK